MKARYQLLIRVIVAFQWEFYSIIIVFKHFAFFVNYRACILNGYVTDNILIAISYFSGAVSLSLSRNFNGTGTHSV